MRSQMNAGKPPTRRFAHTVVWAAAVSSDSMGEITGFLVATPLKEFLLAQREDGRPLIGLLIPGLHGHCRAVSHRVCRARCAARTRAVRRSDPRPLTP